MQSHTIQGLTVFQKCGNFLVVSLDNFSKHKHLISEAFCQKFPPNLEDPKISLFCGFITL